MELVMLWLNIWFMWHGWRLADKWESGTVGWLLMLFVSAANGAALALMFTV